jgi:hypothetical protein
LAKSHLQQQKGGQLNTDKQNQNRKKSRQYQFLLSITRKKGKKGKTVSVLIVPLPEKAKRARQLLYLPENPIKPESMPQQIEKITHIILNGTNYLPWVHTIAFRLGGRSKLEYVKGNYQNQNQ